MKLRDDLTEEQIAVALDHCAQEPIHIPGSIQPHGVLLAADPATSLITHASENLERLLGKSAEAILGKPLSLIIDAKTIEDLKINLVEKDLQSIQSITTEICGKPFEVVAHMSGPYMVIELEPVVDQPENLPEFLYEELRKFAIGMHRAETKETLNAHVVASIRKLTGIDRVKLYQFDPEWNGSVIAESRADFMPSYLGLRFPASDIPEQARKLYMRNYLRLIADISYLSTPIRAAPEHKEPLDLGLSFLRSVSPVHIQYLRNMRIQASMSISIIQNGKLWGLIACHHNSPIYLPYRVRMVAEIMGHIFSSQLTTLETHEVHRKKLELERLVAAMRGSFEREFDLDLLLNDKHRATMDVLNASALIVKTPTGILRYGNAPSEENARKLFDWLPQNHFGRTFFTNDFSNDPRGSKKVGIDGGVLALPLSAQGGNYAVWLRAPVVEDVNWAGDPEKPLEETRGGYRLTPRGSFTLWKQNIKTQAHPWSETDVETARNIVNVIAEGQKINAEQANMAKSDFLASMSHEIRTPMNAVIGLAHILEQSAPLTEKQTNYIRTLRMSADSVLRLIDDLLDISKIEAGIVSLDNIPFDLHDIMADVESIMTGRVTEKGLRFKATLNEVHKYKLLGDPGRVRQVLLNLVSNAVKFTERGGVTVTITRGTPLDEKPGALQIAVSDTGIGIAPDRQAQIFQKYVQADTSITRRYGGTGLGLAITKRLAEIMGGSILIQSVPNKGSTFTVVLDLKDAPPGATVGNLENVAATTVAQTGKRNCVLLVEDYAPNVLVASSILEYYGYTFELASNGAEAVQKAIAGDFMAVLMDVQMAGMNGFEATMRIREFEKSEGKGRRVPIIGLTAHALTGDRDRCIAAGMDDYMMKPYSPPHLAEKLAELAAKSAA